MLTDSQKQKVGAMMLFVAPIVLIKIAAILLGGPRATHGELAGAGAHESAAKMAAIAAPTYSAEQRDAAEYVAALSQRAFGPSPLYYTQPLKPPPIVQQIEPVIIVDPIAVRSIVSSEYGEAVLIHGLVYSLGDIIPDTPWTIARIEAHHRLVAFRNIQTGAMASREVAPQSPLNRD